jgi:O-antigen biosynthesis protein
MIKIKNDTSQSILRIFSKVKGKLGRFLQENENIEEVIQSTVSEIKKVSFCKATNVLNPRLNLIVPSIEKEHAYGGISTALALFRELSEYFEKSRIIVIDFEVSEDSLKRYPKYSLVDSSSDSDAAHQIVSMASSETNLEVSQLFSKLAISETDAFIATIWYSAYMSKEIRAWQRVTYSSLPKSFAYLIQDYEPGFYPWSSQYLLAKSTYRYSTKTLAIFNTSILQDYFHKNSIKFFREYAFEPIMNSILERERLRFFNQKKQKIIVIYGRPNTKRNAFCLIVDSLRHWHKIDPHSENWKIISAGESHQEIKIGKSLSIQSVGKLSVEEYAMLLGKAAIGISFMVSPHPSYPPLEMAHYGMKVITNMYESKDLSVMHSNILALDDVRCENVARKLSEMCRQIEENSLCGWGGKSYLSGYLSQGSQFPFIRELATELSQVEERKRT